MCLVLAIGTLLLLAVGLAVPYRIKAAPASAVYIDGRLYGQVSPSAPPDENGLGTLLVWARWQQHEIQSEKRWFRSVHGDVRSTTFSGATPFRTVTLYSQAVVGTDLGVPGGDDEWGLNAAVADLNRAADFGVAAVLTLIRTLNTATEAESASYHLRRVATRGRPTIRLKPAVVEDKLTGQSYLVVRYGDSESGVRIDFPPRALSNDDGLTETATELARSVLLELGIPWDQLQEQIVQQIRREARWLSQRDAHLRALRIALAPVPGAACPSLLAFEATDWPAFEAALFQLADERRALRFPDSDTETAMFALDSFAQSLKRWRQDQSAAFLEPCRNNPRVTIPQMTASIEMTLRELLTRIRLRAAKDGLPQVEESVRNILTRFDRFGY